MRTSQRVALVAAVGLPCVLWLAACDEPLTPPQLIDRTRVLAARVEVGGDPSRATPGASERVSLRVLAMDPQLDTELTWQFTACTSVPVAYGLPSCGAPAFATTTQDVPAVGEPFFVFDVPNDAVIGDARSLLVEGVVCSRGAPCEGGCAGEGAEGDRVSIPIGLQALAPNSNPSLSDDVIALDGAEWVVPVGLDAGACGPGSSLPSVRGGSGEHDIRVTVQGGDRDRISAEGQLNTGGEGPWETLQIDYYTTAGELSLTSSILESDDPREVAEMSVRWTAPKTPPSAAQLVRLAFVSRDLRGGSDWTIRALCLVP